MAGRLSAASDLEGRRYGISVIRLSPGAVESEMLRRANPQLRASLTPSQVGALIVSLLEGRVVPASSEGDVGQPRQ